MKKLILAVAVLAGIHVCGNSRTLTVAQVKPTPSTGMVVRSGENSPDQQMALMHRQIDSMKRQIIAANVLTLTDTEATKFWPVYEQYSAELKKDGHKKRADQRVSEEYRSLTDSRRRVSFAAGWIRISLLWNSAGSICLSFEGVPGKVTATFLQVEPHQRDARLATHFPAASDAEPRRVSWVQ